MVCGWRSPILKFLVKATTILEVLTVSTFQTYSLSIVIISKETHLSHVYAQWEHNVYSLLQSFVSWSSMSFRRSLQSEFITKMVGHASLETPYCFILSSHSSVDFGLTSLLLIIPAVRGMMWSRAYQLLEVKSQKLLRFYQWVLSQNMHFIHAINLFLLEWLIVYCILIRSLLRNLINLFISPYFWYYYCCCGLLIEIY